MADSVTPVSSVAVFAEVAGGAAPSAHPLAAGACSSLPASLLMVPLGGSERVERALHGWSSMGRTLRERGLLERQGEGDGCNAPACLAGADVEVSPSDKAF